MGKQMKNNNVLHIAIQSGTIKKISSGESG